MKSRTTDKFRKAFARLPAEVQKHARLAFQSWKRDPKHPSLRFKRVHKVMPIFSVRIGVDWRAVGIQNHDEIVWYWIGSHEEYNKLLSQM